MDLTERTRWRWRARIQSSEPLRKISGHETNSRTPCRRSMRCVLSVRRSDDPIGAASPRRSRLLLRQRYWRKERRDYGRDSALPNSQRVASYWRDQSGDAPLA